MKLVRIFFICVSFFLVHGCGDPGVRLERRVQRLHEKMMVFDAHNASAVNFLRDGYDPGKINDFGSFDFPRMELGGLDGCFIAIFPGRGRREGHEYNDTYNRIKSSIENITEGVGNNSSIVEIAYSPGDYVAIEKLNKRALFFGVESGFAINSLERVEEYYDLGIRYMTLCLTSNSNLSDSSTDQKGAEHNGLSQLGIEVVGEMNRLGMMVDASNASDKAFYDILEYSRTPVIVSHAACRALCSNHRNLSDEMLLALKKNGGVINITLLSQLLKSPEANPGLDTALAELDVKYQDVLVSSEEGRREEYNNQRQKVIRENRQLATVSDIVDHIEHVIQIVGIDHVGISTDFDGGGGVEGCEDVTQIDKITEELINRGFSRPEIEKIWGGNFMRVFSTVIDFSLSSSKLQ